jgi:hypothetical protein
MKEEYRICGVCGVNVGELQRRLYQANNPPSLPTLSLPPFTLKQKKWAAIGGLTFISAIILVSIFSVLLEPEKKRTTDRCISSLTFNR